MPHLSPDQTSLIVIALAALCAAMTIGFVFLIVASIGTRRRLEGGLARVLEELELTRQALRSNAELIEALQSRTKVQEIGAGNAKAIDVAVRMARTGATSDELAANSGLTRQEARLLARLHGPARAGAAA